MKDIWNGLAHSISTDSLFLSVAQPVKIDLDKAQPAKLDLDKKSFPKQKNIQNFTIDAQGFRKKKKWKSSHMGNGSYQLTSAGRSAHGW